MELGYLDEAFTTLECANTMFTQTLPPDGTYVGDQFVEIQVGIYDLRKEIRDAKALS